MIIRFFFLLIACQFILGCSDITNELWIEKDGSGRMEIFLDVASFLPQDLMSAMNSDSLSSASGTDEIDDLFKSMLMDGEVQQVDTSFSLLEVLNPPDSVQLTDKEKESLESILITFKGDTTTGTAIATLAFEFQNENSFEELMDPIQKQASRSDTLAQQILQFKEDLVIDMERGIIRLPHMKPPTNLPEDTPDDLNIGLESLQGEDEESVQMQEMLQTMMGNIVTKVHLPGKVQFTNDPNAEIDGNTVIFKRSIFSFTMEDSITPWLIKFGD